MGEIKNGQMDTPGNLKMRKLLRAERPGENVKNCNEEWDACA